MCDFDGDVKTLGSIPDHLLQALEQRLHQDQEAWRNQDDKPNAFKVFAGNTEHVVFQFPVERSWHVPACYFSCWEEWKALVLPIIDVATRGYGYRQGQTSRIMLARLLAGKQSLMHVDHTPSADVPHKIHVPLSTHPDIGFLIQDRRYHLARGQAYEVNNKRLHGTCNPSPVDRIHLIFDYFDGAVGAVSAGKVAGAQ